MRPYDDFVYLGRPTKAELEARATGPLVFVNIIGAIIVYAIGSTFVVGLASIAASLSGRLLKHLATPTVAISVGILTLAFGGVFFFLKKGSPGIYGYLELGAASAGPMVTCYYYASQSILPLLFSLLASVYVAVRGFENIGKGRKNREEMAGPLVTPPSHRAIGP